MKKLIPLLLLTVLVGCAETIPPVMDYADRETCMINEMSRYSNPSERALFHIQNYCSRYKSTRFPDRKVYEYTESNE